MAKQRISAHAIERYLNAAMSACADCAGVRVVGISRMISDPPSIANWDASVLRGHGNVAISKECIRAFIAAKERLQRNYDLLED
jgi:hypothetical protein